MAFSIHTVACDINITWLASPLLSPRLNILAGPCTNSANSQVGYRSCHTFFLAICQDTQLHGDIMWITWPHDESLALLFLASEKGTLERRALQLVREVCSVLQACSVTHNSQWLKLCLHISWADTFNESDCVETRIPLPKLTGYHRAIRNHTKTRPTPFS